MMIPVKKEGAEMPTMLENTAVVSIQVFCLIAATIPSGMPMSTARSMAAKASIRVPGRASSNTSLTGFFCLIRPPEVRKLDSQFCIAPYKNAFELFFLNLFFCVDADGGNIVEVKNKLLPFGLVQIKLFPDIGLRHRISGLSHHQP